MATPHFYYKMQKNNEERKKNVKAKEVITALCKFLSALDVESVPTAEVFRRAKFNKTDAVSDTFLSSPNLISRSTHNPNSLIKSQMYVRN